MKAFLCHSSQDSEFVMDIARYLAPCFERVFYYEDAQRSEKGFITTINQELDQCNVMIIFVGKGFEKSKWQISEYETTIKLIHEGKEKHICYILLPGVNNLPKGIILEGDRPKFEVEKATTTEAFSVGSKIVTTLGIPWKSEEDIPLDPHLFSYEKDIINFFIEMKKYEDGRISEAPSNVRDKILKGCPTNWPEVNEVYKSSDYKINNKIDQKDIGKWRSEKARVVAAALSKYHSSEEEIHADCMIKNKLYFLEAGPREFLKFPKHHNQLRVAVLVSGGIAPGINAVIDGITQRHEMYASRHNYKLNIYGLKNGFYAFDRLAESYVILKSKSPATAPTEMDTSQYANDGGSMLGTSRVEKLLNFDSRLERLERIVDQLFNWRIDILYIIGGDGSMKAAHAIWNYARKFFKERRPERELSVVAIPKTMDNDILWVWQTFGFMSAVERATNVIESLATEAKSNPRLGVIQLFGSDSGFVVSHAVLATRTEICDVALIPEIEFSMTKLTQWIKEQMYRREEQIPYGLVILAETAVPTDAINYINEKEIGLTEEEKEAIRAFEELRTNKLRIEGQTNDHLRTAGLKIVAKGLRKLLPIEKIEVTPPAVIDWKKLRIFTNEPRHLLRAIPPSTRDIILGQRLGTLAVDNALAGYTDFMISRWLTEFVLVPLKLVILGRKRIPETGMFWKSVLAKTGQPSQL